VKWHAPAETWKCFLPPYFLLRDDFNFTVAEKAVSCTPLLQAADSGSRGVCGQPVASFQREDAMQT